MPKFNPNDERYLDYYVVMEAAMPQNDNIEILKHVENENGLNYLRFSTCLQDFYGRNRNRRLWNADHVRTMLAQEFVQEFLTKAGGWPGEAGHPIPTTGEVSLERIANIDPNNCSHIIKSLEWRGKELHGVVETLDEGVGSPGYKFMRNILQGIRGAFSARSLVPQRKNPDGTIDVMGPGRLVCYDRVYLPSHSNAYMDMDIPVKNIVSKNKFETVMESFTDIVLSKSERVNRVIDEMNPALESVAYDRSSNMITMRTDEGRIFVKPELKYNREIMDFMKNL